MTDTVQKLWIFGDSFSAQDPNYDPSTVWTRDLAHRLADHLNIPVQLRNNSLVGSAQDWMFTEYVKAVPQISADDYVVILLTSASRYWYFENQPSLSNWNILDFDAQVTKEQARAAELYIKHIQRPHLDSLSLLGRLSFIAYETKTRALRRPLIIKAFDQDIGPADYFSELNIAQGTLTQVQFGEYKNQDLVEKMFAQGNPGYFKGADCRFNHLCLRNHSILSEKIMHSLLTDQVCDLTDGFHREIIDQYWYKDQEFCDQELSARAVEFFNKKVLPLEKIQSWQQRTGIDRIMRRSEV